MKQPNQSTIDTDYISNPFILAYQAAKRLLNTNRVWAVLLLITGLFSTLSRGSNYSGPQTTETTSASIAMSIELVVFIASFVALFVICLLVTTMYISGMLSYVALQSEKGNHAGLREAFMATHQRFWRLFGSYALAGAKIIGWSLLLVVPGIIAALRYSLLSYVVMDEPAEKSVKASHERVRQLTKGRLLEVFGVGITSIIPVVGALFNTAGNAALYRQLQVYTDGNKQKPKIHWLNYALVILTIVTVITATIVGVVIAFKNL